MVRIRLNARYVLKPRLAMENLYLLKHRPPTPPRKCPEIVIEHFDDGWQE
jgi:hypothetical protein